MMQSAIWLVPRALLEKCGLWNEDLSLINDFEFFVRVLCHASEVRFAPGARLYYRSAISGSLSGQKSAKAVQSAFDSLTLGTQHLLARRNDARARRACATVLQKFVFDYYPEHVELCRLMATRVNQLGGSDRPPGGTPGFHRTPPCDGMEAGAANRKIRGASWTQSRRNKACLRSAT